MVSSAVSSVLSLHLQQHPNGISEFQEVSLELNHAARSAAQNARWL